MKVSMVPIMAIVLLTSPSAALPIIAMDEESQASPQKQSDFLLQEALSSPEKYLFSPIEILFDLNSAKLRPGTVESIDQLIDKFKYKHPDTNYVIEGHTDTSETEEPDFDLGCERARSVRNAFVEVGFPAERLLAVSYGKHRPYALGEEEEAKAQNRRVRVGPMRLDEWQIYKNQLMQVEPGKLPRCQP